MDAKLKRKWTKALRSGKIKQTTAGALKTPDGEMCCLGVLAHVCGARWVAPKRCERDDWLMPVRGRSRLYGLDSSRRGEAYLSPTFLREVGMKHSTMRELADMNDGGESFAKIAAYIDSTL